MKLKKIRKKSLNKKQINKKKIVRKKRSKKLLVIDDVYRLLNKVQIADKEVNFSVSHDIVSTVQNIIKDLQLPVTEIIKKTYVTFIVSPSQEKKEETKIDIDFFEDELLEEGFLF